MTNWRGATCECSVLARGQFACVSFTHTAPQPHGSRGFSLVSMSGPRAIQAVSIVLFLIAARPEEFVLLLHVRADLRLDEQTDVAREHGCSCATASALPVPGPSESKTNYSRSASDFQPRTKRESGTAEPLLWTSRGVRYGRQNPLFAARFRRRASRVTQTGVLPGTDSTR